MKQVILTNEQVDKLYEQGESYSFPQGENASETINNAKQKAAEEQPAGDGTAIPVVITPNEPQQGAPTFNASTTGTTDGEITNHLEQGQQVTLTKEEVEKKRINHIIENGKVFTKKDFNAILLK